MLYHHNQNHKHHNRWPYRQHLSEWLVTILLYTCFFSLNFCVGFLRDLPPPYMANTCMINSVEFARWHRYPQEVACTMGGRYIYIDIMICFVFNNIETDYMNFQILRPPCLSYVGIVLMVNEPDRWIIKIWQEQKSTFKPWTEKQQVGWIRKGIIDDYGPPTIPGIVKQNILQPPST